MSVEIKGWITADAEAVVEEYVLLRASDPIEAAAELWKKATRKTLPPPSPGTPKRVLSPAIQRLIVKRWQEFVENSLTTEDPIIIERTVEIPMDVESELEKVPVSLLMEITGRKLGNILDSLSSATRIHKVANKPKPVKKVKRIRVAIVGLKSSQENRLLNSYDGDYSLKFYDKEKSQTVACTTDWVVFSRHVTHSIVELAQSRVGRDRTIFTGNGSNRSVLEALKDIEKKELALKKS